MNLLLVHSFTWITVVITGLAAFILGFIIRSAIVYKKSKRILRLEDEMLGNHSRILELEQIIAQLHRENSASQQGYDRSARKDQLKAS